MSKPDDIPDDVWEAARTAVGDEMLSHGFHNEAETYRNGGGDDEAIVLSAARSHPFRPMTIHAALVENRRWMFGYAMRLVGDRDAADDIVQAACLTALTARTQPNGNVRSWLYGHVKNAWRTAAKAQAKHAALPLTDKVLEGYMADGAQEYAIDLVGISSRVRTLPEPWRSTYAGAAIGERHSELARRMGVARSTITMRINKVRPYVLHGTPLAA